MIIDQDAFDPGGPNLQPILMVLQSPDVQMVFEVDVPRLERLVVVRLTAVSPQQAPK